MSKVDNIHVWMLQWGNPYTEPPAGMPRVRLEMAFFGDHPNAIHCPPEIEGLKVLGDGWAVVHQCLAREVRKLPVETLARVRRKRLERRMRRKYPLLADLMIEEEMRKKPEYYAGITDERIERGREEVEARERERWGRLYAEAVRHGHGDGSPISKGGGTG